MSFYTSFKYRIDVYDTNSNTTDNRRAHVLFTGSVMPCIENFSTHIMFRRSEEVPSPELKHQKFKSAISYTKVDIPEIVRSLEIMTKIRMSFTK